MTAAQRIPVVKTTFTADAGHGEAFAVIAITFRQAACLATDIQSTIITASNRIVIDFFSGIYQFVIIRNSKKPPPAGAHPRKYRSLQLDPELTNREFAKTIGISEGMSSAYRLDGYEGKAKTVNLFLLIKLAFNAQFNLELKIHGQKEYIITFDTSQIDSQKIEPSCFPGQIADLRNAFISMRGGSTRPAFAEKIGANVDDIVYIEGGRQNAKPNFPYLYRLLDILMKYGQDGLTITCRRPAASGNETTLPVTAPA